MSIPRKGSCSSSAPKAQHHLSSLFVTVFFSALLWGIFQFPAFADTEKAVHSDQFVDSVGINVHLHYTDTNYYKKFPLVQSALVQLGVRHVRDGAIDTTLQDYYDHHNQLGALGIHGLFISSPKLSSTVLLQFPSKMAQSFEGYENINEYDISGSSNWAPIIKSNVKLLYSVSKTGASVSYPVVAPSLVNPSSFSTLGDLHSYLDFGNMHNYAAGWNPGTAGWTESGYPNYGSIIWNKQMAAIIAPTLPVITTEMGYTNDLTSKYGIPEAMSAVYMPRLFLEQWLAGVKRTYLYELLSVGGEDYGLLRADGSTKPSFLALSNLLSLLADPGSAYDPSSLDYSLSGGDSSLHHLLFQKRDGRFYLAMWVESPGYDVTHGASLAVPSQNVGLNISKNLSELNSYQWNSDGSVTSQSLSKDQPQTLVVSDKLLILEFKLETTGQLKTAVSPAAGGLVSVSPQSSDGIYTSGQSVTVTAQPSAGYAFTGFTGTVSQSNNPLSLAVTGSQSVTANFSCSYQVSPSSVSVGNGASTVALSVSTGSDCQWSAQSTLPWITSPGTIQTGSGSISLSIAANAEGARSGTVTVGGSAFSISQAANASVPLTFASSPAGAVIQVDGISQQTPYSMNAYVGSTHQVNIASPQTYGGKVYFLYGWTGTTDGASANAAHTITTPSTAKSFGVNMVEGQQLTTIIVGKGTLSFSPDNSSIGNYYKPTDKVNIYETPASGCSFVGFTGNYSSVKSNFATVYMTAPATITATFTCP